MVIDLVGEAFLPEVTMSVFGTKQLQSSEQKQFFPDLERDEQNDTLKGKK